MSNQIKNQNSTQALEIAQKTKSTEELIRREGKNVNAQEDHMDNPFARSSRLSRSPARQSPLIRMLTQTATSEEKKRSTERKGSENIFKNADNRSEETPKTIQKSISSCIETTPIDENIEKARHEEEEQLKKGREIIETMKAAIKRQPNISATVKDGIIMLEECFSVMTHQRTIWKTAEINRKDCIKKVQRTMSGKRAASSPAEQEDNKKKKEREEPPTPWSLVVKKGKRQNDKKAEEMTRNAKTGKNAPLSTGKRNGDQQALPRNRSEAIAIKPAAGRSYSDVLKDIKSKFNPESVGADIKRIRQTKNGDILLELRGKTSNTEKLKETLTTALDGAGTVKKLEPRCTIEVRDMDCLTEKEEVEEALKQSLENIGEMRVSLTAPNVRQQRMAIVDLSATAAAALLKRGKVKIGWVNCHVRLRTMVQRCYKCLGYGHRASVCTGPDRSKLCYKCGKEGHLSKTCAEVEHCVLCEYNGVGPANLKHIAGSGRCKAFRAALEETKSRGR